MDRRLRHILQTLEKQMRDFIHPQNATLKLQT